MENRNLADSNDNSIQTYHEFTMNNELYNKPVYSKNQNYSFPMNSMFISTAIEPSYKSWNSYT